MRSILIAIFILLAATSFGLFAGISSINMSTNFVYAKY